MGITLQSLVEDYVAELK